jgi:hypothetical protein
MKWQRRTALALVVLASALLAYEWNCLDRRGVAEARFELVPVPREAVAAEWGTLPIDAEVRSGGGERSILRLGPLGLLQVEDGVYPSHAGRELLHCNVRLCDSSHCEASGVVLWPEAFSGRPCGIPEGTWRLRRGVAKDQWLVSYAGPGDPTGPESLAGAVVRSPVPLGVRSPPDAMVCVLGAALLALASSLWRAGRRARRLGGAEVDDALTGTMSAFALASVLVLTWSSPARVEPAWDLRPSHGAVGPADWRSWSLVDMVRGPFEWSGTWVELPWSDRRAELGFLELQSRVQLDRHPPLEKEESARVCLADSCVLVAAPGAAPDTQVLHVVGLRHKQGSDLWAVTYGDDEREREVGIPWARVPHVELSQRMPWLPWMGLVATGISLLFEFLPLTGLGRRGSVVHDDAATARSELPGLLRRTRVLAPLGTVAVGFSTAGLIAGRSDSPILVAGLALAITVMAWAGILLGSRRKHRGETEGLDGVERVGRAVGVAAVVLSTINLALQLGRSAADSQPLPGAPIVRALAIVGILAGAAAVAIVQVRRSRRRAFVARVEAGEVPGYQVAARGERKALLRLVPQKEGYRVADEEVYLFDRTP